MVYFGIWVYFGIKVHRSGVMNVFIFRSVSGRLWPDPAKLGLVSFLQSLMNLVKNLPCPLKT